MNPPDTTAVLLHWNRPENAKKIVDNLSSIPCIKQIIVWNGKPPALFFPDHPKVMVINCTHDFGLDARFAAGLLAKYDTILLQDDDVMLPRDTVEHLACAARDEPLRLHGILGRNPRPDGSYAIARDKVNEEVDIVLTVALTTAKSNLHHFFPVRDHPEICELSKRAVSLGTHAHNGEDILFSCVVSNITGLRHRVYKLACENMDGAKRGLSSGKGHWTFRTEAIRLAKKLFPIK